jgi:hypothetical protein
MEKRLRKPVAATFNCPGLGLLACIISLIKGEYTNQIFSTVIVNDIIDIRNGSWPHSFLIFNKRKI